MTIDLSDRIVLVTGASRGIGEALARRLAASGATVAVHYHRNRERAELLAAEINNDSAAFGGDLASVTETTALFEGVVERYGRIDVLVNNAGVSHFAPLELSTADWAEAWHHTMAVNLRAAEQLTRLTIPGFRRRGAGRIIYIASRAAFRGDTPDYMAYAASKGGMVALARSVARGFGKEGIVAFVVAPGFTRTDMAQEFIDEYGEEYAVRELALDRMTEPADIGPLVTLLASGLADHATGTSIDVNAGSYVR
ncbi:MAG: SDR family NAD(P)-dependent oxidoreductase [Rhodothermales bacterium]